MKITGTALRASLTGGLLGGLLLGLSACGEAPKQSRDQAGEGSALEAPPELPPGISLSDARIQLPAVSGRPGVAYFTVSQASGPPRKIAAVAVELVGRTEMHESMQMGEAMTMQPIAEVPLESGKSVEFVPGGKHVMLFDLDSTLRDQDSVELTVIFDGGDKATAKAQVTSVNGMEQTP